MKIRAFVLVLATVLLAADSPPRMPIPNNYADSILTRWLNKPVLESKMLDDAESLDTWKVVNVDQAKGDITLTGERKVSGANSLRLRCATVGEKPAPGRYYGTSTARRTVDGEDWAAWNRLSAWVYADLPGFRVVSMIVTFHNEGKERVPDSYNKMGVNYVILKNHEWNHVVWEIANLTRDKVTGVDFSYRMQGHEPGASDAVTLYIDKLELQKVNADHYEGWDVAPGQISFSHSGYQTGSPKTAIASDLKACSPEEWLRSIHRSATFRSSTFPRFANLGPTCCAPATAARGLSKSATTYGNPAFGRPSTSSMWNAAASPFRAYTTFVIGTGCSSTAISNWW
jgi:hypothetical protein